MIPIIVIYIFNNIRVLICSPVGIIPLGIMIFINITIDIIILFWIVIVSEGVIRIIVQIIVIIDYLKHGLVF